MVKPGVASKCSPKTPQYSKQGMSEPVDSYLHVRHMVPGRGEVTSADNGHVASSKKRQTCFVIIVLFLSVFVNVILGFLYVTKLSKPDAPEDVLPVREVTLGRSVCVVCESLGVVGDGLPNTVDRVLIGDAYMCCMRDSEHLQRLITLLSIKYSDVEDSAEVNQEDSPVSRQTESSAHLFLDSTRLKDNEIVWTDEYGWGSSFIGHGVEYKNGSLKINQDGRYFVYSFITTKFLATPEYPNLFHAVYRRNKKLSNIGSKVLLIGKQRLPKTHESFLTSYLGACMVLRAGDELTVQVNPQSSVYAYAPANYFGLFKVGR